MAINNCTFLGRLTKDPELREVSENHKVCRFSIAVDRDKSKNSDEKVTDFIDCQAWDARGEAVNKWFAKGDMIGLSGALFINRYTDKEGNKKSAAVINVEKFSFVGAKSEGKKSDEKHEDFSKIKDEDIPF